MMILKFRNALLAGLLACVVSPAAAEDVADFYKGKTVTVIVGYPPASGYTFYGHVMARFFADHIPGKPTVIVQNMPGAGSIKAANYLYNVAPKDGTAVGIFSVGALIDELFGHSTTSFDTTKFGWVGNMDESIGLCVVNDNSGIATFDDLRKKETLFGGTGPSGGATQAALALTRLYGAKIKLIKGYPGAEDVVLAMDRSEVQGVCGLTKTVLKSRFAEPFKSGQIKPIIHDNMKSQADLPGVPGVYDFAKTTKDREVLDLLFGWRVLGRPIAAPPAVLPERLRTLQQAFLDTMKDPRFVAEAQKANLDLAPSSGEEVAALIKRLFSHSKDTVARAAEAVRNN
jgi:tripartite-type tricarboxylate transporter receptor subunit TctC